MMSGFSESSVFAISASRFAQSPSSCQRFSVTTENAAPLECADPTEMAGIASSNAVSASQRKNAGGEARISKVRPYP